MRTTSFIRKINSYAESDQRLTINKIKAIELASQEFGQVYFDKVDTKAAESKSNLVKIIICASLKSLSGDVFELSKLLGTLLLGLEVAGKLAMPLTPLYVAGAALFIVRGGIAALCAETKN